MRAARQRGQVFPAPQARGLSRRGQTGTDAPFACSCLLYPFDAPDEEAGVDLVAGLTVKKKRSPNNAS
ncbi:hypothetical protein ACSVGL_30690, partial [Klebsiella pneumoniae]